MTATTGPTTVTLRIGGDALAEGSGRFDHVSPVTGAVDASIPLAGPAEIDRAVDVAHEAFRTWRALPGGVRARMLYRLAELIEDHAEEFAERGILDNGTPVTVARNGVAAAVDWTRYYAGWADKIPLGRVAAQTLAGGEFGYTLRQPYGVIGVVITWNAPLVSLAMKIPAALAAGNTVVVKPSELTPFSAMLFADLAGEAGLPDGVVNVVPGGAEAGDRLVRHRLVKKVTFTGGPVTARVIAAACAETFKPLTLELGGKSANIIFDDAALEEAVAFSAYMGVGMLSGQGCALPTRVLVQAGVYERVVQMLAGHVSAFPVGDPRDPATVSGPVVNAAAAERISAMIARAEAEGARLVAGGQRLGGDLAGGYFFAPTVFADVRPDSELYRHEVFGPVLSVSAFEDEAEAVAMANATEYGLSGYLWTSDLRRATRVAEQLETGGVMINGANPANPALPFGGIGLSGIGREGGVEGLDEFLWTKTVSAGGGSAH